MKTLKPPTAEPRERERREDEQMESDRRRRKEPVQDPVDRNAQPASLLAWFEENPDEADPLRPGASIVNAARPESDADRPGNRLTERG